LPPQQRTVFSFPPSLWIGAIPGARQSEPLHAHTPQAAPPTLLSLRGVASADIVMTGGGSGSTRLRSPSAWRMRKWPDEPDAGNPAAWRAASQQRNVVMDIQLNFINSSNDLQQFADRHFPEECRRGL
jgi:hypothetical protein